MIEHMVQMARSKLGGSQLLLPRSHFLPRASISARPTTSFPNNYPRKYGKMVFAWKAAGLT